MILIIVQPIFCFKLRLVRLPVPGSINTKGKRDLFASHRPSQNFAKFRKFLHGGLFI